MLNTMNDPTLNNLFKWGIQNTEASPNAAPAPKPMSEENRAALQELLSKASSPPDSKLMQESFDVIENDKVAVEDKEQAFKNFEMMIQGIDNANNMESLGLWSRLIKQLDSDEPKMRMHAAWCCNTAVQNNIRSQERLLVLDAVPTLIRLATTDTDQLTRKKAIGTLSSFVRNFQPGLDSVLSSMPAEYKPKDQLNANDMESVDLLINKLRESL